MQEYEREMISSFVNTVMQVRYGCDAYPLPDRVLVARVKGKIVGTIAISEPCTGLLPIDSIYDLHPSSFPGGVRPEGRTIIQFGRWIGDAWGVASRLMCEAVRYAGRQGYVWSISETKPQVQRLFRRSGVGLHVISGSLRWDRVPAVVRPYYQNPFPSVVMASVADLRAAFCGTAGYGNR